MAKIAGSVWKPEPLKKKTAQARRKSSVKLSSINKDKKRNYKPYKGKDNKPLFQGVHDARNYCDT